MTENFIWVKPRENKIRIFELGVESKIKEYSDKILVLRNENTEIHMLGDATLILPPLGFKFSCRTVGEEKIVCEVEKSE